MNISFYKTLSFYYGILITIKFKTILTLQSIGTGNKRDTQTQIFRIEMKKILNYSGNQYLYMSSKNCTNTLASKGVSNSMVLCLKSQLYSSCHMYRVAHVAVLRFRFST